MNFVQKVAFELMENHDGVWPQLEGHEAPTEVTQSSTYTLEFDEPIYTSRWGTGCEMEVDGFGYMEEYEDGETATREAVEAFIASNPNYCQEVDALRRFTVGEIAVLNSQVAVLINKISELSGEAGIACEVNLGKRGSIDLDGDWDSSSC
jgi:hypothetical protein